LELWLLILIIFFITVLLIVTRRVHLTTAALIGAVLASIALITRGIAGQEILLMIRLEPILVIAGMTVVAEIMRGSGVFQFLAVHFIRFTRGDTKKLFILFCLLTASLSTVLMNTVVILVMGYLTILTCQAIEQKPHAFLLGEMLAVGAGGAFSLIGTSTNVIIADYAGFDFIYYILQFWGLAIVVVVITILVLLIVNRRALIADDPTAYEYVVDFDPWMMVPNRRLFWIYMGLFILLILGFVVFPQAYVVAIAGMTIFMIISHVDPRASLRDVEWQIIFFIGALFVLAGSLELVGLLNLVAEGILFLSGGQLIPASLLMLWLTWVGASVIGSSPMATTFAPIALGIASTMGWPIGVRDPLFWGVGFGSALGGVASPIGSMPLIILSLLTFKDSYLSRLRFLLIALLANILQVILCSVFILLQILVI
jgi:Na+/H+ antiporter NhaD/arsenite permease-like protein